MKLLTYILLLSSSYCFDNLITYDLEHGSMMTDGKILPGDHRSPDEGNVFLGGDASTLAAIEDDDVSANLHDFKDI